MLIKYLIANLKYLSWNDDCCSNPLGCNETT